ncbi:MAG: putative glycosyltransferase, exosortase G system-associated [Lachnospiraceae bacterium]|nr:putative glycosyltransferase, exosortase G system-associated [Lachnospiraceae bacterium]
MKFISEFFHSSIFFWAAWVIIPIIMEVIPTVADFFILLKKKVFQKKAEKLTFLPEITLIVPVYNSADSLYRCIRSIYESDYDNDQIYILLVNNMSTDNSFEVFCRCQKEFPELTINWVNSKQGKSKALNLALFNSYGKYIIHIDSDGMLQKNALRNMVTKFEQNPQIHCMTGTIMTNPEMVDGTKGFFKRQFRKLEFFEYCQAFLAGRNFQSEFNNIFTLSGAFSAFRKSSILKTQLYNTDTVCEDTHVTFQIRDSRKEKVALCNNAIFFVDPIEDMNRLYIQRQRWQRGELEVMHMFMQKKMEPVKGFFSDFVIRLIMFDHTFAFPRMIWYFALICLGFINYPFSLIIQSVAVMYLLYVFATVLLYFCIILFLADFKDLRRYYARKWYLVFFLPLYNFLIFWFRFAGIINSVKGATTWRMRNFTEELEIAEDIIRHDFLWLTRLLEVLRKEVNIREEEV